MVLEIERDSSSPAPWALSDLQKLQRLTIWMMMVQMPFRSLCQTSRSSASGPAGLPRRSRGAFRPEQQSSLQPTPVRRRRRADNYRSVPLSRRSGRNGASHYCHIAIAITVILITVLISSTSPSSSPRLLTIYRLRRLRFPNPLFQHRRSAYDCPALGPLAPLSWRRSVGDRQRQ